MKSFDQVEKMLGTITVIAISAKINMGTGKPIIFPSTVADVLCTFNQKRPIQFPNGKSLFTPCVVITKLKQGPI